MVEGGRRYVSVMSSSGVRLNEVLVAVSMATDLGLGQPSEHMVRAARLSMRLGERLGLDTGELATLYDVSLLTYVGCPVYGNEAAMLFGDDIDFRAGTYGVDLASFSGMVYMVRHAGQGTSVANRVRRATQFMATRGSGVVEQMANHCSAAGLLADRARAHRRCANRHRARPTRVGTARGCPATSPASSSRWPPGSPTSPKRSRCWSAPSGSNRPSR